LYDVVSPWVREAQIATSEHQALKILKGAVLDKNAFDLILVNESRLSVVKFAELVKSDREIENTELILVTAVKDLQQNEIYAQAGYRDVLPAPVDVALLFNTLHNAVVEDIQEAPEVSRLADYFPVASKTGGLDILVAEDNPINQKVASKILERAGHHVDLVENGQLALEKLEHNEYDLTILDMQMPVMGGVDAIKMFRFTHLESKMPFIMLTANATVQAVKACEDIGVDAFVTKPFQARKLIDTIDQVAAQHKIFSSGIEKFPVDSTDKDETPSTDLTKLAELASLSHEPRFLEELVYSFMQDGALLIQQMKDALNRGEVLRLKEVAHAFKGSAASLGAMRLYETGIELSDLTVAGFREEGELLIGQAENEFSLVTEELRNFLKQKNVGTLH